MARPGASIGCSACSSLRATIRICRGSTRGSGPDRLPQGRRGDGQSRPRHAGLRRRVRRSARLSRYGRRTRGTDRDDPRRRARCDGGDHGTRAPHPPLLAVTHQARSRVPSDCFNIRSEAAPARPARPGAPGTEATRLGRVDSGHRRDPRLLGNDRITGSGRHRLPPSKTLSPGAADS